MAIDLIKEDEVCTLVKRGRTALWRLKKEHGFPEPVLTRPSYYNREAVEKWLADGGVNRAS
ncbi:helix-turn-helix transcriptional regulator [Edwardsiella piscicida]|uniref:helix-turn-helix transcriptional regulator n=1 Tax=Edwardsiella TaxID=635 RepID=UPI00370DCD26